MIRARTSLTLALLATMTTLAIAADLPTGAIVRQGTAVLTMQDMDAFAARIPPDQRAGYFDNAKRLETTLRQLLVERQIANDARAIGLDKEPVVQSQILLSTESTLSAARVAKIKESVVVPDLTDLASERYQANRESFNVPETLDVQHILISFNKHTNEEALALANKVHAEAVANPEKFLSLVTRYSEDPSAAENRGLMRQAGDSSKYVAEFAKAANELKTPEQISPVVKTKFGYHVLMLIKRAPASKRTFAEVKDGLIQELRADYVNQQVLNYMQGMQNNEVESNAELVNSLRTRFGDVPTDIAAQQPSAASTETQAAPTNKP